MRGAITPHVDEIDAVLARVRAAPKMDGLDLVPRRHLRERYEWTEPTLARRSTTAARSPTPPIEFHVVAYDFGIKENILRQLRDIGCARHGRARRRRPRARRSRSAPTASSCRTAPAIRRPSTTAIAATKELIASGKPVFGICLGHQILGLALGGADAEAAVRPPRRQPPGARQDDRQGRDHVAEPRVRRRRRDAAVGRARSRTRTCSITRTRASRSPASRSSASSTTPRRARVRTTRATCSRGSAITCKKAQREQRGRAASTQVTEELYARHTADAEAAARRAPRVRGAPRQGPPGRRAVGAVERRVRRVVRRRARRAGASVPPAALTVSRAARRRRSARADRRARS